MVSNFISKVRQIIADYNPDLNTKTGSAIYSLLVVPSSKVFETIQGLIDTLSADIAINTATDKEDLLSNFRLDPLEGSTAKGKILITVDPSIDVYVFPTGTIFTSSTGEQLQTLSALNIPGSQGSGSVEIETVLPSDSIYDINESLTSSLYGDLILSVVVSEQITGGSAAETDDELLQRIDDTLTRTTLTNAGIKYTLGTIYTSLVDVLPKEAEISRIGLNRKSGLQIDVLIKSSLITNTVTVSEIRTDGTFEVDGTIIEILSTENTVESITRVDPGTSYAKSYLKFIDSTVSTNTLTYTSFSLINEVQDTVDNGDLFPIGVDIIIQHARPVFVSGTIQVRSELASEESNFRSYINNHLLSNFYVSDMLQTSCDSDYKFPVTLTFTDIYDGTTTEVQDEYISESSAYFFNDIRVEKI